MEVLTARWEGAMEPRSWLKWPSPIWVDETLTPPEGQDPCPQAQLCVTLEAYSAPHYLKQEWQDQGWQL